MSLEDNPVIAAIDKQLAEQAAPKDANPFPIHIEEGLPVAASPELEVPSYIEPKADLIYGATGTGKTVNIEEVSNYVLAKYGKLTRLASCDGGGFGPLKGLVDSGQIEFWAVNAWPNTIACMHRAVQGYWPLRPGDPESPLVRPDAGTYAVYGFGAYEGLTSFGDTILRNLKEEKASLSQDPSFTFVQSAPIVNGTRKEEGLSFSGGNMSYYGFLQDQLNLWVTLSHLLGYERVLWTALESRGDDSAGSQTYGPMIGGKKATGKASQWFCNTFHMEIIPKDAALDTALKTYTQELQHVLFLKTHLDALTRIPFGCKIRAPKAYAKDVPTFLSSGSVADAYRLLDAMYEKQSRESKGKLSDIANLKERLLANAVKARAIEAKEAERRAKASGQIKTAVTVPGGATSSPAVMTPAGAVPQSAGKGPTAATIVPPAASLPAVPPTIQNVRAAVKKPAGG